MARLTLANGMIFDTDTGTMVGGSRTDTGDGDPSTFDPPVEDPTTTTPETTAPAPDQTGFDPFKAGGRSNITVPENIATWINSAAGGDMDLAHVIAGVIYQRMRWGKANTRNQPNNQVTPALVDSIAAQLAQTKQRMDQYDPEHAQGDHSWASLAAQTFGADDPNYQRVLSSFKWTGTTADKTFAAARPTGPTAAEKARNAPATADDILGLYETYLGRAPEDQGAISGRIGRTYGSVLDEISGSKEATQYRLMGDKINAIRSSWANSLWRSLGMPSPPTNTEIMNIINNGWSQQQTETYMKSQPYGSAKNPDGSPKTVGQAVSARDAITKAFEAEGLTADEGTINDFIANNHPITNAGAYVSQYIKQHGLVNPSDYADMRKQLAQTLAGFGVNVNPNDIDPALLAAAVAGHWTADQMTQAVGSRQAPGAPPGTTLDRYKTSKDQMDGIWKTYFPNVTMPQTYRDQMMAMTPDAMAAFIGAMPSIDAQQAGLIVPVKTYNDAKAAAQQALSKWGAVGATPTPADLAYFAAHGFDAEAVAKHYQTDPTVLAANPGAQYGMTREQYRLQRSQTEQSYANSGFAAPGDLAQTKAKQNDVTPGGDAAEPDWLAAIFKSGQTPDQAHAMFGDYFKRQGRAPTADEAGAYQSRHKETFSSSGPSSSVGAGGTMPALAGPAANRR